MSLIMLTIVLLATVGLATSTQQVCSTGSVCMLKCGVDESVTIKLLTWTREDLNQLVLSYRSSDQALENLNPAFKDRVQLSPEERGRVNTSLTITNITKTDMGNYTCSINSDPTKLLRRKRAASDKHSFTVELVVNDQAEKRDTQNEDNTHPDAKRVRIPLVLGVIAVMAAVGCVVGLIYRRRGFLGTPSQPVRVPTLEETFDFSSHGLLP